MLSTDNSKSIRQGNRGGSSIGYNNKKKTTTTAGTILTTAGVGINSSSIIFKVLVMTIALSFVSTFFVLYNNDNNDNTTTTTSTTHQVKNQSMLTTAIRRSGSSSTNDASLLSSSSSSSSSIIVQNMASREATDIIDNTCSFLPDFIKELEFPRHLSSHSAAGIKDTNIKQMPLVWLFDSGVMIKTNHLKDSQMNRFWNSKNQNNNIWEVIDEPLMMKAVGNLYHRCLAGEQCVMIDGGAAFGYYTQLIRLHFPLIQILAFNPHPTFVEQMIDNLSLRNVPSQGISLQQKGLAEKSAGTASLPYGTDGRLIASLSGNTTSTATKSNTTVEVITTTLDEYYEEFGKNKLIVLIKLDVEGYGGKVKRGSPKMMKAAQNIFFGIHNRDEKLECENLSKEYGFTILDKSKYPDGNTPNDLCIATRHNDW